MQSFSNSLVTPEDIVPVVGMGATIVMFSDRRPAEVIRVSKSGKTCWIKSVHSKIVSGTEQDGSAVYEFSQTYEIDPEYKVYKSKNGGWKQQGTAFAVWLNRTEHYNDPHF